MPVTMHHFGDTLDYEAVQKRAMDVHGGTTVCMSPGFSSKFDDDYMYVSQTDLNCQGVYL